MLEKFPDKEWDFREISFNQASFTIMEKYPNKNWDWYQISKNKNLTIKFIEKHIDEIDFSNLSYNDFNYYEKKEKTSKKIKLFHYLSFSKLPYDVRRYSLTFC